MLLFRSYQRASNDKSEIPATEPPKAQYAELVQLFGGLQDLELKTVDNMFNPEREQALLGPFFKGEPTIPFFEGGNYPDFRFARMVPDTKAVDIGSSRVPHIVAYKTHEAPQLAARTDALLFRAASGSGKTSTIFDAACVRRTIYVVCQIETQPKETQLQESVTGDIVFPQLVNLIFNSIPRAVSLADAQEEARRLITADICARLSFFLWLHQTFPGITPEQALLVQLNGGRGYMLRAFNTLRFAHENTLHELAKYCVHELKKQLHVENPVSLAIDEAQAAAPVFNDPKFHFTHIPYNTDRGLLYEYCRLWRLYIQQPVVVAGTGLSSDAAEQPSSNIEKDAMPSIRLPFLTVEDVKARLGEMLDVSNIVWEEVYNLEYLTGRCRFVASVIKELMNVPAEKHETTSKTAVLVDCIQTVCERAVEKLASGAKQAMRAGTSFSSTVTRLLQQLHAMAWLFSDQAQGMRLLFDASHATELLGLGLVLLKDNPTSTSISVAMDKIGYEAVLKCANDLGWNAAATIAQAIAGATNINDIELGYKFETLVAAAIVRFPGTVAELIHAADVDYRGTTSRPQRALPTWTEDARFNCKYHVCANVNEVVEKINTSVHTHEKILVHPDNAMRPDYLLSDSFLLLGSAKCLSNNLSGIRREHDFESTILRNAYTPTSNSDGVSVLRSTKTAFTNTERALSQLPTLRLHVVLPGYAAEEHNGPIQHVQIDEDKSIRLVIDATNYGALFQDAALQQVFASILERKMGTVEQESKIGAK